MLSIVSSDAAAAAPFLALQPPKPQITYTKSVRYTAHIDEKLSRTVCNVKTWRQLQSSQPSPPPPAPSQPSAAETAHFEKLCTPFITTNNTKHYNISGMYGVHSLLSYLRRKHSPAVSPSHALFLAFRLAETQA
jgi:hypothetical protein